MKNFDSIFVRCSARAVSKLWRVLLVGIAFDDWLAQWIRRFGTGLLCATILVALCGRWDVTLLGGDWEFGGCVMALIGLSFLWAYLRSSWRDMLFVVLSVMAALFRLTWQCYLQMRDWAEWEGVRSYLAAFVILIAAGVISAFKGSILVHQQRVFGK
jgi:hypothetical protein